jgi:peptidoglycan/xylan/chitin deacetylase (PgdA/CDA1 family)
MLEVSLGIDVEPDCPPYLATQYRGVADGLPRILDALDRANVPTTCFCTGQVAERFPHRVNDLVRRGHELASHGHTHRPFDTVSDSVARGEITVSTEILRSFGAPVTSFRAPNLRFPDRYLPFLEELSFVVDSSQAKYKGAYYTSTARTSLRRVPVSMTSSVLRLPSWIRDPWLSWLASPVVLFVHPWEFIDLTNERLRLDCRFRTGQPALRAIIEVVTLFRERGAIFRRMRELGSGSHVRAAA